MKVFLFLQVGVRPLVPTVIVPMALILCAGLCLFRASIILLYYYLEWWWRSGILNDDAIVVSENVSRIARRRPARRAPTRCSGSR